MDKIWDRKSLKSEVIGCCVAGMKKPNDHAEPTTVEGLKKQKKTASIKPVLIMYMHI